MLEFLIIVYLLGASFSFTIDMQNSMLDELLYGESAPTGVLIIRSLVWPIVLAITIYDYFFGEDSYGIYS